MLLPEKIRFSDDACPAADGFVIRNLKENDADAVFRLCRENPQYYRYCPPPVTPETIRKDMQALPPGKEMKDKYYLGFFDGETLAAVLDLIDGYPDPETAFFGFFMMAVPYQNKGTGSALISRICGELKKQGFKYVRLARAEGNPQPDRFWHKNGFTETGTLYDTGAYTVIVMQRTL